MAVKKVKKRKIIKGTVSGRSFTSQPGAVNDSIGRVIWASKVNAQIFLENLTDSGNTELRTPPSQTVVNTQPGNTIDCFYKFLSSVSRYYKFTEVDKTYDDSSVDKKTTLDPDVLTNPAVNVYKIRLTNNINCLDIRNNDPFILTGTDSAPFDFFNSIAISNAEVVAINNLPGIKDNPLVPKYFDLGLPTPMPATGYRTYYMTTLSLKTSQPGAVKGAPKVKVQTNIVVYSVDKCNWISHNYATAAFNLLPSSSPVWDNQIIPNIAVGTNPFSPSIWSALTSKLTTIMSEADDLPASGDKKGFRLLNTPIREYIYKGDLDSITFEIAFRLPFYTENYKVTPYTNQDSGRINNPYWTKFETWFGYANSLRTVALYPSSKLLARTGQLQSMTDSIQANPDHADLYKAFAVPSDNVMSSNHVPAYIACIMGSENGIGPSFDAYFTIPGKVYADKLHIRLDDDARIAARTELKTSDLLDYKNQNKISTASYNSLIGAGNNFVAVPIINPSRAKGYFVFKSGVDHNFYVYNKILSTYYNGQSGITVTYGYDMGGGSYGNVSIDTSFDAVTGFYTSGDGQTVQTGMTPITSEQKSIINGGFNRKKSEAVAYYYTYYERVYLSVHIQYSWAVAHIVPFMKHQYFITGINSLTNAKNNFFKVYVPTPNLHFYDAGAKQFFNEVEKVMFGTVVYNGGASSFNNLKTRLYFTHAVNTHDVRWMKEFFRAKKGTSDSPGYIPLITFVWRRAEMKKLLESKRVVGLYDFKKTTL